MLRSQRLLQPSFDENLFAVVHGQHSELFQVIGSNYSVRIECFATRLFGIVSRGAHLTAYTQTSTCMKIWVPRRSAQMKTYPNILDTTVTGGVRAGESPFEETVHELDEEASLPADLVRRDVRSCGVLTYMSTTSKGFGGEHGLVVPDTVYLYDIEFSEEVVPESRDDEANEFYLMSVDEVMKSRRLLLMPSSKQTALWVRIDFFIRHGIITAENEKDFVEINMRMHRKLPF
jgi:8-oxo-dGTP pyrophosphatase MutT (NUDIX family)